MQQVRVHGPDDVRLDEIPEPECGPTDALVRVASCGICGTDLRYVRLGGLAGPTRAPMPLGHELAGTIEALGSEVEGLAIGSRVVLQPTALGNMIGNGGREGGFTPRLRVRNATPGTNLFPIPDDLPFEIAALTEPLGVGMNAVDRIEARPGDKVAVFGAGPIGLAAIATLHDRGVEDVIAVDLSARRLEIAEQLGARASIDAAQQDVWKRLRELHGESPVLGAPMAATHAYVEASGAPTVIPQILQNACSEARLAVVALHDGPIAIHFLLVMMKQLTIRGAMEYPNDYQEALSLLTRQDLTPMISHRFPLERFPEALATAQDAGRGAKVMVDIGSGGGA